MQVEDSVKAAAGREFMEGARDTLPILVAAAPFGIVFGAAAVAAGNSFYETVLTSAAMFAGASQFVFIEVNAQAVPAWMVVLAVFAINFRHILYSASIGRRIAAMSFFQKAAAFFLRTRSATWYPSRFGRPMSSNTISGRSFSMRSMASAPE